MIRAEVLERLVYEVKRRAKRRRFTQSMELIAVLRDYDVSKPENRVNAIIPLPHPIPNKLAKVAAIAHGGFITVAKEAGVDMVLTKEELESLAGNKKAIRKLAQSYDFFITTPDLMSLVGRILGPIFGPRGKIPEPVPPTADVKAVVERLRRSVRVRIRSEPSVKTKVGSEDMETKLVVDNILAVFEELGKKIDWSKHLDRVYIKLTMGSPVAATYKELLAK